MTPLCAPRCAGIGGSAKLAKGRRTGAPRVARGLEVRRLSYHRPCVVRPALRGDWRVTTSWPARWAWCAPRCAGIGGRLQPAAQRQPRAPRVARGLEVQTLTQAQEAGVRPALRGDWRSVPRPMKTPRLCAPRCAGIEGFGAAGSGDRVRAPRVSRGLKAHD